MDLKPSMTLPLSSSTQFTGSARIKTQLTVAAGSNIVPLASPNSSSKTLILPAKPSLMDHASPSSFVASFCVAVMRHLIPNEFWGNGEEQTHNRDVFIANVKKFVHLRRFESMTLHEVTQGIKVCYTYIE